MDEERMLIIWFKNGSKMLFEKVTKFCNYTENLSFVYFEMCTQKKRKVEFYKRNIAGYTLELQDDE
ncbi:hypothetical protein [Enterococcus faecium]|uniref:Uncharacterized protein n=1 Tax=Enterococcus faecium TaxID=1352 RepID=A0A9X3XVW5_ENTFC|nr:hypothetical protein [Enterococcus faecium]MDC4248085.1 hypothetical protein [Enterococcus faecium]